MTRVDAKSPSRLSCAADIAAAAQLACLLEASAPKPGNVSPGHGFDDLTYEDFLASAAAIGGPLSGAGQRPLGETVRLAVEATGRWSSSNTNLGMILLLAPLARAAAAVTTDLVVSGFSRTTPVVSGSSRTTDTRTTPIAAASSRTASDTDSGLSVFSRNLRSELCGVLNATTVADAREVYTAIRRAAPGGLGSVGTQDVANEPDVTLLDAMRLAAGRDGIAREYATTFAVTFETGVPALDGARRDALPWSDAVLETFLTLLANAPDTHVARRGGTPLAEHVSRRARAVLDTGGVRSAAGRRAIDDLDLELRDAHHIANPGTTADLTAAAIFVVLLGGAAFGGQEGGP